MTSLDGNSLVACIYISAAKILPDKKGRGGGGLRLEVTLEERDYCMSVIKT